MRARSWWFLVVLCLLPRAVGLFVNREANDDHIQVVELWLEHGHYPDERACWECFQPPLYTTIQYSIARSLALNDRDDLIGIAHGINFCISVAILGMLAWQIQQMKLRLLWQVTLFLFFALNPKLMAINIQATNDTLVIALSMAALHLLRVTIRSFKPRNLVCLWCIVLLAGITKGNGLVLVVGVCLFVSLLTTMHADCSLVDKTIILTLFLISLPIAVSEMGHYYEHYERNGTPFSINQPKAPSASFLSYDGFAGKRLGVRSISDSLLTFRFVNLLQYPSTGGSGEWYPEHRTSFWTLLYGQAYHSQFEYYPPSWRSQSPVVDWVARALYVLGLAPAAMLACGMAIQIRHGASMIRTVDVNAAMETWLYPVFSLAFVVFLVKYSLDYRDYANTKLIFLFPVLPAAISFVGESIDSLDKRCIECGVLSVILVMIVGFVANFGLLILTLTQTAP